VFRRKDYTMGKKTNVMECDSNGILTNEAMEARGFKIPCLFDAKDREFIKDWGVDADTRTDDILSDAMSPYTIEDDIHGNEEYGMEATGEIVHEFLGRMPKRLIRPEDLEEYGLEETARDYKYSGESEPCWWKERMADNGDFIRNSGFLPADMMERICQAVLAGPSNYIALHSIPPEGPSCAQGGTIRGMFEWEFSGFLRDKYLCNMAASYGKESLQDLAEKIDRACEGGGGYADEFLRIKAVSCLLGNGLYDKSPADALNECLKVKDKRNSDTQLLLGLCHAMNENHSEAYAHLSLAEKLDDSRAAVPLAILLTGQNELPSLVGDSFATLLEFYRKEKRRSRKEGFSNLLPEAAYLMFAETIRHKDVVRWTDPDYYFVEDFYCLFSEGFGEQLQVAFSFLKQAESAYEKRRAGNPLYKDAEFEAAIQDGIQLIPKAYRKKLSLGKMVKRMNDLQDLE